MKQLHAEVQMGRLSHYPWEEIKVFTSQPPHLRAQLDDCHYKALVTDGGDNGSVHAKINVANIAPNLYKLIPNLGTTSETKSSVFLTLLKEGGEGVGSNPCLKLFVADFV